MNKITLRAITAFSRTDLKTSEGSLSIRAREINYLGKQYVALESELSEELLALYRSGQASPVDATQAVLARAHRLNPRLNAFCLIDDEAALTHARASEARWQAHRASFPLRNRCLMTINSKSDI